VQRLTRNWCGEYRPLRHDCFCQGVHVRFCLSCRPHRSRNHRLPLCLHQHHVAISRVEDMMTDPFRDSTTPLNTQLLATEHTIGANRHFCVAQAATPRLLLHTTVRSNSQVHPQIPSKTRREMSEQSSRKPLSGPHHSRTYRQHLHICKTHCTLLLRQGARALRLQGVTKKGCTTPLSRRAQSNLAQNEAHT